MLNLKFINFQKFQIKWSHKSSICSLRILFKKRYITAWESSNEFRNKIGEKNFKDFINWINKEFPKNKIKAKYFNNCWLFQKN